MKKLDLLLLIDLTSRDLSKTVKCCMLRWNNCFYCWAH